MVEIRNSVEIKLTTVEGNYSTKISIQPCVSFTEMFLFNIFLLQQLFADFAPINVQALFKPFHPSLV